MAIAALPEGTLLAHGRYRLTGVLARSNFSVTYHARDLRAGGAEVVIKEHACSDACYRDTGTGRVIAHPGREQLHLQLIERVMREATLLLELRHAHVVRLDGAWEELGTAFCAMELVPGRTLDDDVRAAADVPLDGARWARIRAIALALIDALEAAHARGIYHCDLKPENVLVSAARGAVLVDFGAARSEEQLLLTVTLMPFTPGYAAPELRAPDRIREVGPWTDAYAWGMLVLGLAAGHADRGAPVDAVQRLLRRSWPAVADGDPYDDAAEALAQRGMPEPWAAAIQACLRLDPAERPRSMAALRALLGEGAARAPVPVTAVEEAHTGTPPPVVVAARPREDARPSGPGLTEPGPELGAEPRPSAWTPTRYPSALPAATQPGSPPAHDRRAAARAPLALGAAALLIGGACGALLWRGREAPTAAAPPPALPPQASLAADPAPAAQDAPPASMRGCEQGKFDCNGRCQWTHDPGFGCGRCGAVCDLDHVRDHACAGQQCAPKTCEQGYGDCDGKPANGCETGLTDDEAHCGACGVSCAMPGVTGARCEGGRCKIANCASRRGDCDGLDATGCEADLTTDVAHCGVCKRPCVRGPHVESVRCEGGDCRFTCAAPWQDRDGDAGNGCEHAADLPGPPPLSQRPLPELPDPFPGNPPGVE